ncbi:MAG: pre-peptidase C-terminal domain-containing protein [Polyangiaceae bacterium]|nr:pre-peptidase C-terminal domain-containing protein [Polyangiaceae bacterium]
MRRFLSLCWLAGGLATMGACSSDDNQKPIIEPISDQTVAVGQELTVAIIARDPDGDPLTFKYRYSGGNISDRATLQKGPAGNAVFRWTPIAADLGQQSVDFVVSDGQAEAKRTVNVDVRSAVGSATAPLFIQPLGTGTTLDLSLKKCIQIPIEVQDSDTSDVSLAQEPPLIEGSSVQQTGGHEGVWEWCPTAEQIAAKDIYKVVLSAHDYENPKVLKDYLIVLQKQSKGDCPGDPPVVVHQPSNEATIVDLTIDAHISDDKGLKFKPLVQYALTNPGAAPDPSTLTQVTMLQIDGDLTSGTWAADIPNPVANQAAGSSATLYYRIVANDDDDDQGDCDHVTYSPATGMHQMTVTNPGGAGNLGPCKACSSDVQCGGGADTCITLGGKNHCGKACSGASDCPSGYSCSPTPVASVSGASSRQCIPNSQSCEASSGGQCVDDQYEPNDTIAQVATAPALPPGTYSLKSCSAKDWNDDYYPIQINTKSKVKVTLTSSTPGSNLNLYLRDSSNALVASSAGPTSNETFEACVDPGRYYIAVWEFLDADSSYTLSWSNLGACSSCSDDNLEPNNSTSQATDADVSAAAYKRNALMICSGNDDFFEVFMVKDETLHATAKFTQTNSSQDLDLYLRGPTGALLVGCTPDTIWDCDSSNGQSGSSNEKLSFQIPTTGNYYVVVHGWEGSQNGYDLCIDYTSSSKTTNGCPPP